METTQLQLSREDMNRIAKRHGCTINMQSKTGRETYINLRHQGATIYLGKVSVLSAMSAEQFADTIAAKLAED